MIHSKSPNQYAAKEFAPADHARMRHDIDVIWYFIVGLAVAVAGLTILGLMDWTPKQANIPQANDVFTQAEMQEALENGSLELHPY